VISTKFSWDSLRRNVDGWTQFNQSIIFCPHEFLFGLIGIRGAFWRSALMRRSEMPGWRAMKGKEKCPRSAGGYGRP
jgi:hypothetical protein